MFSALAGALDEVLARAGPLPISAVAAASLAASVVGVDEAGNPLTPVYLYSDTRDAAAAERLKAQVDWGPIYARTGCPAHTMYLPPRFLWLRDSQPELFERVAYWLSLHEFFLNRLFGRRIVSYSLASWTGLLNRTTLDWDQDLLDLSGVRREQFTPLVPASAYLAGLKETYARRWPALANVPFFPAVGDGAAANLGSGCVDASRVAVTIGTSGAARVVVPAQPPPPLPRGLWLYSVDGRRGLLGGSLNNGGNTYAYLRQTLQLPPPEDEARELAGLAPAAHGLTVLPFFAGERSPGYHAGARAAIVGLNLDSSPLQILQAVLEAIAFRVAAIWDLIEGAAPAAREVIASGAALLASRAWVQILADVLGQAVTVSGEEDVSARGAVLLALDALGLAGSALPARLGATCFPRAAHHEAYRQARERHEDLYSLLVGRD